MFSLDCNDLIIILSNVLLFIITQTLLFKFKLSKTNLTVIEKTLINLKKAIPTKLRDSLLDNIETKIKKNKDKEEELKRKNLKYNNKLLLSNILLVISCIIILILSIVIYKYIKKIKFQSYHYKLLGLVLLAYLSEVVIIFLVIDKYEYMNIYKTIKNIYSNLIYNPLCLLTSGLPDYNTSLTINKSNNI